MAILTDIVLRAINEQWDDRTLNAAMSPDEAALVRKAMHLAGRDVGPIDITECSTTKLTDSQKKEIDDGDPS